MKTHMAIDQYGETLHDLGPYPRKGLLERLGSSHAEKMYIDNIRTGEARHCGYIVGGHWWNLYEVTPINEEAA